MLVEVEERTNRQDQLLCDVVSRDCQCSPFTKALAGEIYELPREMVYRKCWEVLERVRALGLKHLCFNHLRYLASKGFKMLNSKGGITKQQLSSRLTSELEKLRHTIQSTRLSLFLHTCIN